MVKRWRHPTCDFPWLLASGYPTRSETGTWGMQAHAYTKPAQKGRPTGAGPALPAVPPPSGHCTRASLLGPPSHLQRRYLL